MARAGLLPGETVKHFTVQVEDIRLRDQRTSDGRSANYIYDLFQTFTYVGTLRRRDGLFSLLLEWVDIDDKGHRVLLPHEVVTRICDVHERVMAEARSERAKQAMQTRRRNGYVPSFPPKISEAS